MNVKPQSSLKPFQNPKHSRIAPTSFTPKHSQNAPALNTGLLFRQKLLYLQNLNINSQKALHQNPKLRTTPISNLKSVEHCLSSMGIPRSSMGRILDMFPHLLTLDPHLDLYPIFDFLLNEVSIPYHDIHKAIIRCPRILLCSVDDQLRPNLRFLEKLGFVGPSRVNCQTALLLVSSVEGTIKPKIEFLRSVGLSYEEVGNMVVRSPMILTLSVDRNLVPKFEFFVGEMKGDLGELKRFPQFFSFSLEKKIKPRHRLLVKHGFSLPLADMLKVSDGEFGVRLVEMRLQLLEGR